MRKIEKCRNPSFLTVSDEPPLPAYSRSPPLVSVHETFIDIVLSVARKRGRSTVRSQLECGLFLTRTRQTKNFVWRFPDVVHTYVRRNNAVGTHVTVSTASADYTKIARMAAFGSLVFTAFFQHFSVFLRRF